MQNVQQITFSFVYKKNEIRNKNIGSKFVHYKFVATVCSSKLNEIDIYTS